MRMLVAGCLSLALGCAHGPAGYRSPVNNEATTLDYVSRMQAEMEERKKARREMREPRLFSLPLNGHLVLGIHRPTLEEADTAKFQVIFARGEQVLGRVQGPKDLPEMPEFVGGPWTNTLFVHVPEGLLLPFEVMVVDQLSGVRYEFLVRDDGQIKRAGRTH
jgi:hypothetical protein